VEPLLGPRSVSEALDISEATLRHWRAVGRGPAFLRVGRHIRYRSSAIEAWLEEQQVTASQP
jgi:predicted DNA-binding transcriptional regulator AlpA